MALGFTDTGTPLGDTGNTSPHSVASRTYTAGRTYLIAVLSTRSNPAAVPTSVSGTGITFSLVTQTATFNSGTQIGSIWKATPSSTTTTAVSIAHAATTGTAAVVLELTDANSTNLVVQSAAATPVSTAAITATLASGVTSGNASVSAVFYAANSATSTTPDTGWTSATGASFNTPASGMRVAYSTGGQQDVVWTGTAVAKAALIVEVAAARVMAADVATYTATTPNAALTGGFRLSAAAASFALTGVAATLTQSGATPVPTSITWSPTSAQIAVAGTVQLTATVLDQFGAPMAGQVVNIRSSDATIATPAAVTGWSDGVYLPADTVSRPYGRTFDGVDQYPGFTTRGVAELPQEFLDTTRPDFSGYTPTVVTNSAQFLTAYAACDAAGGGVIQIADGATITQLQITTARTTSGWILVTHETTPADWPDAYERITQAQGESIPCSISTTSTANAEAMSVGQYPTPTDVHHLWFRGLKFVQHASQAGNTGGLVLCWRDTHHLVFEQCYTKPASLSTEMQRDFYMAGNRWAVIDSHISGGQAVSGNDTQGIGWFNGAGPAKIVNNYVGGVSENVLVGGGRIHEGTIDTDYYPCDLEVRRNHFYTPQAVLDQWTGGQKNRFELKTCFRAYIAENVFENHYDSGVGQVMAVAFKSTDQDGATRLSPFTQTRDITFYDNILLNVAGGVSFVKHSDPNTTLPLTQFDVDNVLVVAHTRSSTPPSGSNNCAYGSWMGCNDMAVTRYTATGFAYAFVIYNQDGYLSEAAPYTNTRFESVVSDAAQSTGNVVAYSIDLSNFPTWVGIPENDFRTIFDQATGTFKEVGVYEEYWGGGASAWPQAGVNSYAAGTVTHVATSRASSPIAFVNADNTALFSTADYTLQGSTPFKDASGNSLGCDFAALMTRCAGVRSNVTMGLT